MSFCSNLKDEILSKINKKDTNIEAETFGEYITTIDSKNNISDDYCKFLNISKLTESNIKGILKGCFLSSGYITNPNVDYHLENIFKSKMLAQYYVKLLSILDFSPKVIKRNISRKYVYVVYLREAEQISFFLSILGASSSLLKFEEIRVEKEVKNNINRNINCETANLSKTIRASVIQLQAIENLKKHNKFDSLNDKLKEACNLREKNKEESLETLASMLNISKSGLKHRLDKIVELSNEIKGDI